MKKQWFAIMLAASMLFGQAAVVTASDADAPVTEPDFVSGTYAGPLTVTLTSSESGTIYYTLDGTDPSDEHYDGMGPHTGTEVEIAGFITELRYRAVDEAGNWEATKKEMYKQSGDPVTVVAGMDPEHRYLDFPSVDGGNVAYAREVHVGDGEWIFSEVYVSTSEGVATVATGLSEAVDYTGISGDHVIYGNDSTIWHYSIETESRTTVYDSEAEDIESVVVDGDSLALYDEGELIVLDIADPSNPRPIALNGYVADDVFATDIYDLRGNKIVWEREGSIFLEDLITGEVETLSDSAYPDALRLTETTVYYIENNRLFAIDVATHAVEQVAENLDNGGYLNEMLLDRSGKPFMAFYGDTDGAQWLGVLNLTTKAIKYLDFEGDYSELGAFAIDDGTVYWSKWHLDFDEANAEVYYDKAPIYSLDLDALLEDSSAPSVLIEPDSASFDWIGEAEFELNEDAVVYYTTDGSAPTAANGYSVSPLQSIPVFLNGVIRFAAVDFAGNVSEVGESGEFDVAYGPARITSNKLPELHALAGNHLAYLTGSEHQVDLYLYDIPTRTTTLLAEGFGGFGLDFDGRYVVTDNADMHAPAIHYFDIATGMTGTIESSGSYSVSDGKIAYLDYSEDMNRLAVYDIAADRKELLDIPFDIAGHPYLAGHKVVFTNYLDYSAYIYDLNSEALTKLVLPGDEARMVQEAVPIGDQVFIIADGYTSLLAYDIGTGTYTDLTESTSAERFGDLSADELFGRYMAVVDDTNYESGRILLYDTATDTIAAFGSGEFEFAFPQVSGNTLVALANYGSATPNGEVFQWQLNADHVPPTVQASLAPGLYNADQTVSFSVYGGPASVFYTLDGSEPTFESTKYAAPFTLTRSATVNYAAIDNAGNWSEVQTANYVIDKTKPIASAAPAGGIYPQALTVFVSSNEPAEIYYSLDGSEPTVTWSVYEQEHGLSMIDDTVLKFKAVDEAGNVGDTFTQRYVIDPDAPRVSVAPAGGTYYNDVTVTMDVYHEETSATVYYTLDGSEPETSSTRYEGPFRIAQTADLKWFAQDAAGNRTETMTVRYVIRKTPPTATVSPADGSRDAALNAPIKAVFDVDVTANDLSRVAIKHNGVSVSGTAASLSGNELTVSRPSLQYGATYVVTIPADTVRNIHGVGNEAIEWSFSTVNAPSGGGVSVPSEPVEGEPGNIDTEISLEQAEDGRMQANVTVDPERLGRALAALAEQDDKTLAIQIDEPADITAVRLPAGALAQAAAGMPDAVLSIQTAAAGYRLPIGLLDWASIASELGVQTEQLTIVLKIEKAAGAQAEQVSQAAQETGGRLIGDVYDFSLSVTAGSAGTDIHDFGNVYVARTLTISQPIDGSEASAVAFDPLTGTMRFVPAVFATENGRTIVTIKRNGNSLYAVVQAKRTFEDLSGHWAKDEVELLASKLLVSGVNDSEFMPNAKVTRAEFAALLVRALGLAENAADAQAFADVEDQAWYAGSAGAAAKAGLVTGYEDGAFGPNRHVTREEMAAMFARALRFAGYSAKAESTEWTAFGDRGQISEWAAEAVAEAVEAGIVQGKTADAFAPLSEATRAEAVVMLKRFLQVVGFMN